MAIKLLKNKYLISFKTEQMNQLNLYLSFIKVSFFFANFQAMNSSQKQTNEFVFTTMRRVSVHFLEEIETPKKPFEIT